MVSDGSERLAYVLDHYWNGFLNPSVLEDTVDVLLCDSLHIGGIEREELEQAVSNYVAMVSQLPLEDACARMTALAAKVDVVSSSNAYSGLREALENYLYDSNSPLRDEDIYGAFAGRLAQSSILDSLTITKYADQAQRTALNRRGTRAADFTFTDREGRIHRLSAIKADWTILFFSNPGCHACKDIIEALGASEEVSSRLADGSLAVLNIYIDEDLGEWYEYMPIYPDEWYNGYDHNHIIRDDNLYDVRAIPSLYLLDKDKKVIFKDATLEKLMNNLPWQVQSR